MPIRSYSNLAIASTGESYVADTFYINYANSPKVAGKLALRSNPMQESKTVCTKMAITSAPNGNHYYPIGAGSQCDMSSIPGWDWGPMTNEALARFRGRTRKGSASLGVTLASWKQSRDMIVSRSKSLGNTLDATLDSLRKDKSAVERLRRQREPLAGQVLETEFGWRPLFEDMHAALFTACQDGIPPEWVRGRTRGIISVSAPPLVSSPPVPFGSRTWYGDATVIVAAKVAISNPNLWMLNRLGLINPGTVIWDLIPWSFVVNMFVNANALISQFTDEVGLSVTDISTTRTASMTMQDIRISDGTRGMTHATYYGKRKDRTTGSLPAVSWQVKVPKLNWELALIASSLVVQKMSSINKLIRVL